jgi:hypothetical protein
VVWAGVIRIGDKSPTEQTEKPKTDFDDVFAKELPKKQVDEEDDYLVFLSSNHFFLDACPLKIVAKLL